MVRRREEQPSIPPEYTFPKDLKKVLDKDVSGVTSEISKLYMKVLSIWETAKCIDIMQSHYFQLLKMALYIEEYQCKKDMKKYDLRNKRIFKTDTNHFLIGTDDWSNDEKPLIRTGDLIDIIDTTDNKLYSLRIENLDDENIIEASGDKFLGRYSTRKLYTIKFRYNNYTDKCRHYALWLAYRHNILTYLFPTNLNPSANSTANDLTNLKFYNPNIKSNFEQVLAVVNILQKSSYPYPYILYGPPGTGKTATIVECICQIIVKNPTNYILVCTPSNTAADEVTKRLLDYMKDPKLVYRMYSGSQDPSTIDKKILPCSNGESGKISFQQEVVTTKRIVITTLSNSMKLIRMKLTPTHFSHVIIDEAGQSVEPDMLIPLSLVSGNGRIYSQIVLAGDPLQLGPTVISKLAENVLGRSILERLMSYPIYQKTYSGKYNPKFITKLLDNYRSHPDIIRISNVLFYNNDLNPKCLVDRNSFPVIFHGVSGKEQKGDNTTSSRNLEEVRMVLEIIQQLIRKQKNSRSGKIFQKDIGIVTPFKLQSQEIKKQLNRKNLKDIDVGTVELFQGQEKKIIIISSVRTKKFGKGEDEHIGSLSNPKRFNVAVTRAKNLLIIVGYPNALQTDPSWRYLLKYCIANKSYNDQNLKFNMLENSASNYDYERSKIIVSSDLFKWTKFKIFKLDESDSNTEVMETMRMILYPEPLRSIQNYATTIRPVQYSKVEHRWPNQYYNTPNIIHTAQYRPVTVVAETKKSFCSIL